MNNIQYKNQASYVNRGEKKEQEIFKLTKKKMKNSQTFIFQSYY